MGQLREIHPIQDSVGDKFDSALLKEHLSCINVRWADVHIVCGVLYTSSKKGGGCRDELLPAVMTTSKNHSDGCYVSGLSV